MNETPKIKASRRFLRALLTWLASFIVIALALGIGLVTTDGAPKKSPDIVWAILFGALGASLLVGLLLFVRWVCCWRNVRRLLIGLAILATLLAIFYTEEDWRGKRAWENCKRELEAKGAVLDWDKFIPPPVPDDQNFFKAPRMTEWFVRGAPQDTNQPFSIVHNSDHMTEPVKIADIIWLPPGVRSDEENADLTLQFSLLGPAFFEDSTNGAVPIKFEGVPVATAIESLARLAGINYELDPKVDFSRAGAKGQLKLQPTITEYWQNIAPRQVLMSVLHHYGLQLVGVPGTGIARITLKNPDSPQIYVPPEAADKLKKLLQDEIGTNTAAALGFPLLAKPLSEVKPVRIVFSTGVRPGDEQIVALLKQFYPYNVSKPGSYSSLGLKVKRLETYSMQVTLDANSAAGYLAWSDQSKPGFDLMREALKRPFARMDGDYSKPYEIPIPNFIAVRAVAQTLAARAQCYLLLGQPDKALQELTLLHDMCRLLEAAPTGKPMTLVAAMINVAVTGLYVDTIAGGIQSRAWQEPQLAALQQELAETKLTSPVVESFREGPARMCRIIQTLPSYRIFNFGGNPKAGSNLGWLFWPRGWTYQNLVNVVVLELKPLDVFDMTNDTIEARKIDGANREVGSFLGHKSPYRLLAAVSIPNFSKAEQTTAHNQTMANEAQIVCALERYRLAHGEYPETLDALVPQFIEKLPHDIIGGQPSQGSGSASQPLHYRRTDGGKFLLYSVGWNETDDGGQDGGKDFTQGDWVWQYPAK